MRFSAIFTALTGLAVAGGSVYFAREYVSFGPAAAQASTESETVSVLVASRDISFGEAIRPGTLTTIDWPRTALPSGVFTNSGDLLPTDGSPPRRARRPIAQGELILQNKVSDYGEKVTIVQSIGDNHRAIAIEVDAETAVGGFVTPGDRVDIVMTAGAKENLRAVTILQNIRVIGVDQEADVQTDQPSIARTVTVAVTPDQGQRLALAQRAGKLSLTLRAINDTEDRELATTRLTDLLREPTPETPDEPARRSVIRIRRGMDLTESVIN
ncbi:Flp pilus assembly protein CpaB [Ruegeria sp. WL0004]|uniref:Flp pilus assembly protein CpaB n=1 Tax=Ruegeria marisflavi TaxID=2984152 RepID=A0ABT2WWF2_9RHOB|nr:Flp pilus assembly protein CpaB [Ruegeria sp. WL0004]MCU9840228.1 Flp pilus assembly protein CpaB [Ruegeria sp. WL0004]